MTTQRAPAIPLEDREARRQASRSTVNVAVTAGAGTGKTTLLIDTVLAKLLVQGRELTRVLMLTFTEKAANEMRLRLGRALRTLRNPTTEEEKDRRARWEAEGSSVEARLDGAIALLDRAEIGTIHGFCSHVLREHPLEAGVDPSFVVDEGARFDAMFRREWPAWLDGELGRRAPRRALWLRVLEKAKLRELEDVARSLSSFEVPDEALDPARARVAGEARLKVFRDEVAARVQAAIPHCGDPRNKLRAQFVQIAAYLKDPSGGAPAFLHDAVAVGKGWDDADEAKRVADGAFRFSRLVKSVDAELGADVLVLLTEFARRFRRSYTAEGLVSFDGLLTHVRALLRSTVHRHVRERLKGKYDAILVDEFQDTDPAQGEILLFLAEAGRAAEARDVVLAPGKLFIVGDPKQSIYSFRGADIVAYGEVKKRIAAQGGREDVLRTNFRSHAGIIQVVNGIFSTVIRESGELQPRYEEILPLEGRAATMPSQRVELALFEGDEDEEFSASDARRAEAAWIARRLKAEIGRAEIRTEEGAIVKLQRRHIAILFKALTDVHIYLEALRAQGVEYVVEGEKYFYGTSEVVDVTNLLRAVADPHDRIATAGLLRSPLGGQEDQRLFELRKQLDYRVPFDGEPGVFVVLRELRALVGTMAVAELIDRAFERTSALEIAAASTQGEQAVANLLKLRQTAHALDLHGGLTLRQFVSRAKESVRELEEEGESPLADETLDAVRVLSIHKSKGLEFPMVVLPDLHRKFMEMDERVPVRFDWPTYTLGLRIGKLADAGGAALAWHEARRRREEARRVFYVAMTRARETLVLTGGAKFGPASNLGLLREAVPAVMAGSIGVERIVKVGDGELRVTRLQVEPGRGPRARVEKTREEMEGMDWEALAGRWRERREEERKAGTREEEREEPDPRRDRARSLGTLCHRVLEHVDFRRPEIAKLLDQLSDDPSLAAEARPILEGFVRSAAFRDLAKGKVLARELPFLLKEGTQGTIDLVIQLGGKTVVVDYKTEAWSADAEERHAAQQAMYVKAVKDVLGIEAEFRLVYLRK